MVWMCKKNEYNKDTEPDIGIKVQGNKYMGEPRRRHQEKHKSCKKLKKKNYEKIAEMSPFVH